MKGIIVKPKPCCGYSASIGNVVESVGKPKTKLPGKCVHCQSLDGPEGYVELSDGTIILDSRIKWFPDFKEDLLIEEKEKEEV